MTQLEIMPQPPGERAEQNQPWPTYPMLFRVASAHEEGGDRVYSVSTEEFVGDEAGRVRALRLAEVVMGESGFEKVDGTEREIPAELVLLAMGFTRPAGRGPARAARRRAGRARQRGPGRSLHVERAGRLRRR